MVLSHKGHKEGVWKAGQPPAEHRSGTNSLALPRTPWISPFLLKRWCSWCLSPLIPVWLSLQGLQLTWDNCCFPVTVFPVKAAWGIPGVPVPVFQQKLLNDFLQKPEEQPCLPFPPAGCNILTCRLREQVFGRSGFLWWTGPFWGQQQWRGKNSPIMSKGLGSHVDVPFKDL